MNKDSDVRLWTRNPWDTWGDWVNCRHKALKWNCGDDHRDWSRHVPTYTVYKLIYIISSFLTLLIVYLRFPESVYPGKMGIHQLLEELICQSKNYKNYFIPKLSFQKMNWFKYSSELNNDLYRCDTYCCSNFNWCLNWNWRVVDIMMQKKAFLGIFGKSVWTVFVLIGHNSMVKYN